MQIEPFYDKSTGTLTYVIYDPSSKDGIVIDPVLDYEPQSSSTATLSVDRVLAFAREHRLNIGMIVETHAHADHLSGAQFIVGSEVGQVEQGAVEAGVVEVDEPDALAVVDEVGGE